MIQTLQSTGANVPVVTAILGSSPVTGAVSGIIGVLNSLGLSIKGSTRHLSYDEVVPKAAQFAESCYAAFSRAYTKTEISRIQTFVKTRFLANMQQYWGLNIGLNQQIASDILQNYYKERELARQFCLFIIWIGTNTDADSATEFGQTVGPLFSEIFLRAVQDADLSVDKLKGEVSVPKIPAQDIEPMPVQDKPEGMQLAGLGGIGVLAIGGIIIYAAMKGG